MELIHPCSSLFTIGYLDLKNYLFEAKTIYVLNHIFLLMTSKKITIVGSHFVGKTNLCKRIFDYLNQQGHNVGFLREVVRDCPFPVNEMATVEAQSWILDEQKRREFELEKKNDIVIMDRGVIDNYAYWLRVAQKLKIDVNFIEKKQKDIFNHSKNYDLILFLHPFESDIQNDNFRSIDPEWRKQMHDRVFDIMERFQTQFDVPVISLRGTEEEVFEQARRYVDGLVER